MLKDSEQSFKIFVAHSRDLHGMPHSFGKCALLTIEGIGNLVSYLQISCLQIGVIPFEIKGVFVRNNEPDLHNVNESPKTFAFQQLKKPNAAYKKEVEVFN